MRIRKKRPQRVGIYAGVFNPVHAGHITFALQAIKAAQLDGVVFVPERNPRHKSEVEHFAHRVAMLKQAIRPYPNMAVLELVDRQFTVTRTWPQLQATFSDSRLVMLMGSDAAMGIPFWPQAGSMLKTCELVVGVREGHELDKVKQVISSWQSAPRKLHIFDSFVPDVSSSAVREALRGRRHAHGLLHSVQRYAQKNWLYISLENS